MDFNLEGKKAIVCGSTQGIGKATAEILAGLGASIILVARNASKLETVRESLPEVSGSGHHFISADFTRPNELQDQLSEALPSIGNVHILVNNTGGPPAGKAIEADPESYRIAFNQHLICNQILAAAVVPGMKNEKYGRIVNVISTSVKQPLNNLGVSNTIRGAVANWAKTLAGELGGFGITVNNVLPGATETGRLTGLIENKAKKSGQSEAEVASAMKSIIPAGRFGKPEEVASAIAFLASPLAAYINGINLPVDGGRTKCL